jgi:hypothetical protein
MRKQLKNFICHSLFERACMELAQKTVSTTQSVRSMNIRCLIYTIATKKGIIWAVEAFLRNFLSRMFLAVELLSLINNLMIIDHLEEIEVFLEIYFERTAVKGFVKRALN